MNGHTKASWSKCKKCKKRFFICQAGSHGPKGARGWKICSKPCSCGRKYYPDTAKAATDLEPAQYGSAHPAQTGAKGYNPIYYPSEANYTGEDAYVDETYGEDGYLPEGEASTTGQEATYDYQQYAEEQPALDDAYEDGAYVDAAYGGGEAAATGQDTAHDDQQNVEEHLGIYGGYEDNDYVGDIEREGSQSSEDPLSGPATEGKSRGKGKAQAGKHVRQGSQDTPDQLALDMAGLNLQRVSLYVEPDIKDGTVRFTHNGRKLKYKIEDWVKEETGEGDYHYIVTEHGEFWTYALTSKGKGKGNGKGGKRREVSAKGGRIYMD